MARNESDAEALAYALIANYPVHAFEIAVRLRADALGNSDVQRASFWDDVMAVLAADNL